MREVLRSVILVNMGFELRRNVMMGFTPICFILIDCDEEKEQGYANRFMQIV
jgi:hypothetical protein